MLLTFKNIPKSSLTSKLFYKCVLSWGCFFPLFITILYHFHWKIYPLSSANRHVIDINRNLSWFIGAYELIWKHFLFCYSYDMQWAKINRCVWQTQNFFNIVLIFIYFDKRIIPYYLVESILCYPSIGWRIRDVGNIVYDWFIVDVGRFVIIDIYLVFIKGFCTWHFLRNTST